MCVSVLCIFAFFSSNHHLLNKVMFLFGTSDRITIWRLLTNARSVSPMAIFQPCGALLSMYLCEHELRLRCDVNDIDANLHIFDRGNARNMLTAMGSITMTERASADTNKASPGTLTVVGALANRHHGTRYCLPMRMHAHSQKAQRCLS